MAGRASPAIEGSEKGSVAIKGGRKEDQASAIAADVWLRLLHVAHLLISLEPRTMSLHEEFHTATWQAVIGAVIAAQDTQALGEMGSRQLSSAAVAVGAAVLQLWSDVRQVSKHIVSHHFI